MKETRYWTWSNRKHNSISYLQPPTNSSYLDSWEEQAFAVDAAGLIGGCVWPPRSYPCSFCRREFRSAQALGGHMNVHRRDRARLTESPYPHDGILHKHHDHQDHIPNTCSSLSCNPNHPGPDQVVFSSPSLASRVSSPTPDSIENPRVQFTPSSRLNLVADMYILPNNIEEITKSPKFIGAKGGAGTEDHVKVDLSFINLNTVMCQIRRAGDVEEEEGISCKRRRTTGSNSSGGNSSTPLQSEVLELSSTSTEEEEEEELDLELRLG